jgi:hypothetical protein
MKKSSKNSEEPNRLSEMTGIRFHTRHLTLVTQLPVQENLVVKRKVTNPGRNA